MLDTVECGFRRIKIPTDAVDYNPPRPKFPADERFAQEMMALMQNKLIILRNYFMEEAKDLIIKSVDKTKRGNSEQAMLDEAANPAKLLPVTTRAQDLLRLVLYYVVLLPIERMYINRDGTNGALQAEHAINIRNHHACWLKLRTEIGEQLPGDRKKRASRAGNILEKVLELAVDHCDQEPEETVDALEQESLRESFVVRSDDDASTSSDDSD
ncbi:hypothetical protein N0V90_003594 [Kalmusia sp. IMI 367209]|nr:hypothetical protein N0V90_003594 [Kalmusia sp. IMI 367209]